jgi:hypothetical protein
MVQDCFQVEVRVVTAGKVLKIDVGEGAGDAVQADDVADHEAVMPGTCLQAHGVIEIAAWRPRPSDRGGNAAPSLRRVTWHPYADKR